MEFRTYILVFLGIYIFYLLFVVSRKKTREKFKKSSYVSYLVNVYKIDVEKLQATSLASIVTLVNSFILATGIFIAFPCFFRINKFIIAQFSKFVYIKTL